LAETESYKSEPVGRIGAVACELYVFPVGSASGVTALLLSAFIKRNFADATNVLKTAVTR